MAALGGCRWAGKSPPKGSGGIVVARPGGVAKWSPDSRTLYVIGRGWTVYDVATGRRRPLTKPPSVPGAFPPSAWAVSPDGKRIAIGNDDPAPHGKPAQSLYVVETATGRTQRIFHSEAPWRFAMGPVVAWLPQGVFLFSLLHRGGAPPADKPGTYVIRPDGTGLRRVAPYPFAFAAGDGSSFAYGTFGSGPRGFHIVSLGTGQTNFVRLSPAFPHNGSPMLVYLSARVAIYADRSARGSASSTGFLVDLRSMKTEQVALPPLLGDSAVSPNGRWCWSLHDPGATTFRSPQPELVHFPMPPGTAHRVAALLTPVR